VIMLGRRQLCLNRSKCIQTRGATDPYACGVGIGVIRRTLGSMNLRPFLLAGLVVAGLPAAASYEMALIFDVTNRQILRFDPVSQRSLGAFGQGQLGFFGNENKLTLDPFVPGSVLATDIQGYVRRINYSTGEEMGTTRLSETTDILQPRSLRVTRTGDYLATIPSLNQAAIYDRNTGAKKLTMVQYSGYSTLDAVALEDGTYATLEQTFNGSTYSYHLFRRNASGSFTGWSYGFATNTTATDYSRLSSRGGRVYASGLNVAPNVFAFDATAVAFSNTSIYYSRGFGDSMTPVVFGHGSAAYFALNRSAGNAMLYRVDTFANYYRPAYEMPYSQVLGDMVMVVAPEPATFAALGLGMVGLLRRRRRQA